MVVHTLMANQRHLFKRGTADAPPILIFERGEKYTTPKRTKKKKSTVGKQPAKLP